MAKTPCLLCDELVKVGEDKRAWGFGWGGGWVHYHCADDLGEASCRVQFKPQRSDLERREGEMAETPALERHRELRRQIAIGGRERVFFNGKPYRDALADLWDALEASERRLAEADDDRWKRYRRADGSPVFVRLTWPTGAKEVITLEGLAFTLPDYLDDFDDMIGEEWGFEVVKMTQEEYDNLPEFAGP